MRSEKFEDKTNKLFDYEYNIETFYFQIQSEFTGEEKISLYNITNEIRNEMDMVKQEIQDQMKVSKLRFEKVCNRFIKQILIYSNARIQKIREVTNKIWHIRALFQNILSFLPISYFTTVQKVNKFWKHELEVILELLYAKYLKNEKSGTYVQTLSPIKWISCLFSPYPDLGEKYPLVGANFYWISSLQFSNYSPLHFNFKCGKNTTNIDVETEWLRLYLATHLVDEFNK